MNNTKSQNDNLYSLTLLVKKNKKIFGKERTNERERGSGGGGYGFCPGGRKQGRPWRLFAGSKAQKAYCLRAKHTFFRKYGTKKAENRPPSMNPGETG